VRKQGLILRLTERKLVAGSREYEPSLMVLAALTISVGGARGVSKLFGTIAAARLAQIALDRTQGRAGTINGTPLQKTTPIAVQVEGKL